MLDTLTVPRGEDDFNTVAGNRHDPGGFLPEARTGAREAAAHMKDLAERFAELRNAIMRLPGNPSRDDRAGLRHRLLHLEHTLMSARAASTTSSSPSWTPTTRSFDNPRGACRAQSCQRLPSCDAPGLSGLHRPTCKRV